MSSARRSDETTSSDGTDELFEDAVDTLQQIGGHTAPPRPQLCDHRAQIPTTLKCPPLGPPPPLPLHLVSSTSTASSPVLHIVSASPTSPLPPPLPPRKLTMQNGSNSSVKNNITVMVTSSPPQPSLSVPTITAGETSTPLVNKASSSDIATNNNNGTDGHIGKEWPSSLVMPSVSNSNTTVAIESFSLAEPAAVMPIITPLQTTESKSSPDQQQQYQQSKFGRERGHAKTNSLDRGLSLAKSMKTGPFPPPVACSKSNSLTRGASPIETLPTILDEQDQSASTVIQSVIQQVLSENNSLAEEDGDDETTTDESSHQTVCISQGEIYNYKRTEHNGTEPHALPSSTNVVSHYENLMGSATEASAPPRPAEPCQGTTTASPSRQKFTASIMTTNNQKNIVAMNTNNNTSPKHISSRSSQSEVLCAIVKKQQQQQKALQLDDIKKFHRRSASDRSPAKLDKPSQLSKSAHKPTHQKSSTWESHQAQLQHRLMLCADQQHLSLDIMDPITRDVERRMSLKAKEAGGATAAKSDSDIGNDSADDDDDVFGSHQHRHTGLDHVRRFARSYGVGAVDFLRGAVRKAKQIPEHLTKNVSISRATKKSEIIAGEKEDGASSIADSDIDQLSIAAAASEPNADVALMGATPTTSAGTTARKWRFGSAEPPRGATPSVSAPTTSAAATSSSQGQGINSAAVSTSALFARTGVCRPKNAKKGPFDFEHLALVQEMNNEHTGAVWCVKFSGCGRLLATAGQDRNVRIWVLHSQLKHFALSPDSADTLSSPPSPSPVPSSSASSSFSSSAAPSGAAGPSNNEQQAANGNNNNCSSSNQSSPSKLTTTNPASAVFAPKPLCVFRGHTADVLDLSWSPRNYFLLSSGMDRTAKLWHLHRNECLCSFQHIDFVTCLAFMPKDDRYFISGSLDGKIRLWHIPEKKVAIWNEVEQVNKFITAMTFVKNGKFVVVGTFLGRCFFYSTDQLKYHTVIDVRSSRGRNSVGHKITSLAVHGDKLLVASDDSRIRIYDLRDMDLCCKFKGAQISQSLIRAAFSPDGTHVVSGSEDAHIYLWRTGPLPSSLGVRKDRNHAWERIRAHQTAVVTAVFAPKPQLVLKWLADQQQKLSSSSPPGLSLFRPPAAALTSAASHFPLSHHAPASATAALSQHHPSISNAGGSNSASLMMLFPNTSLPSTAASQHTAAEGAAGRSGGSGRTSNPRSVQGSGDVIVSADLTGSLKVFVSQFLNVYLLAFCLLILQLYVPPN